MTLVRKCASSESLQQVKDVTSRDALLVRSMWKETSSRREARMKIDRQIATHGVEFLGIHKRTGEDVYYCNAGDTYATTIIFIGPRLTVGCWGDLVEKNLISEFEQL